jgi:hypothetical protein
MDFCSIRKLSEIHIPSSATRTRTLYVALVSYKGLLRGLRNP